MNYIILRNTGKVYAIESTDSFVRPVTKPFAGTVATRHVTVGIPPYYRVTGLDEKGNIELEELDSKDPEWEKVDKWVGQYSYCGRGSFPSTTGRLLLNDGHRIITDQEVRDYLQDTVKKN